MHPKLIQSTWGKLCHQWYRQVANPCLTLDDSKSAPSPQGGSCMFGSQQTSTSYSSSYSSGRGRGLRSAQNSGVSKNFRECWIPWASSDPFCLHYITDYRGSSFRCWCLFRPGMTLVVTSIMTIPSRRITRQSAKRIASSDPWCSQFFLADLFRFLDGMVFGSLKLGGKVVEPKWREFLDLYHFFSDQFE